MSRGEWVSKQSREQIEAHNKRELSYATKRCNDCDKELPLARFRKDFRSGKVLVHHTCNRCRDLYYVYGLTFKDFNKMMLSQGNCCKICNKNLLDLTSNKIHIDHSMVEHSYGDEKKVRGILCNRCNQGLGYFDDDPSLLIKAAKYILGELDESRPSIKSS